jgi:hypothetical protein
MEQVSYIHVDSRNRDSGLFPFSNTYTVFLNKPIMNVTRVDLVSAIVTNPFSTGNAFIWLDITELRTPNTYDARKLGLTNVGTTSNVTIQRNQTSSLTPATSFAVVPLDVPQNFQRTFKEANDYAWSVTYPSRLDSIERLTIRWLDTTGAVVNFGNAATYDPNMFVLRVYTQIVPTTPERPLSLPPPVREGLFEDKSRVYLGALGTLIVGLIMIMLVRKRR